MKRLLAAATAVLGLVGSAAAAPRDTLVLGNVLEPPHLDVTGGAAAAIREIVYANVMESLTRIDAKGEVKPALAKSWTVSPDGLTYTFKLETGARFHDGTKFDCSIVQFSYARAVAADSTNAQKPLFEPIASTECLDPGTAVVTLKRPTASFLFNMGWADAAMIAPSSVATLKTNPIGTGPFRFKRWLKGDRIELERNPEYWGTPAKLSMVTFRFISDPAAAAAAVLAGDVDGFANFPAPETLDQFRADQRFTVDIGTTAGKVIMSINNARKPFDDVRVRHALQAAIDRKTLVEAMSGLGTPIGSHYVPGDPGFVDLTGVTPYDPAKAKALLAEAGVKPETFVSIVMPPPAYARRGGEVIAAMLEQAGLQVKLVPMEWAQWLDQVFKRSDFELTIIAHVEPRDLEIYARSNYYFNYVNGGYRDIFEQYKAAVDPAKQLALLGDLQRKLAADQPAAYLYTLPKVGVWNAKLRGMWDNSPVPANDVTAVYWTE